MYAGHGTRQPGERGPAVTLRGTVTDSPRCIRTCEGWEVASLLVGPSRGRARGGSGRTRASAEGGLLVVCAGAGASEVASRVGPGEDVMVVGRLVSRRAGRPEDDAVELAADAVLVRRRTGTGATTATEPRIAP